MWALPFYDFFLLVYGAVVRLMALGGHAKARLWVQGRRDAWQDLADWRAGNPDAKPVWMHCASLGEFEQGRPLLEAMRQRWPKQPIVLSFFSPSGYEVQKHYGGADLVFYLPEDGRQNARQLLQTLQPSLVLFVKYEFWFHYISHIQKAGIPLWLISGIFRPGQPFFQWYGGLHRQMLKGFQRFFVQNEESLNLLQTLGFRNADLSGDTRFDRVLRLPKEPFASPHLEAWLRDRPCLMAGSTWPADEALLAAVIKAFPTLAVIVVPHHVDAQAIAATRALFPEAALFTELATTHIPQTQVLVVNTVGMLSKLYRLATLAYVGGGLSKTGIHNVLEPAVYGLPVLHGPHYAKYQEAVDLLSAGGSMVVEAPNRLRYALQELQNDSVADRMGRKAKEFVRAQAGATEVIMERVGEVLGG